MRARDWPQRAIRDDLARRHVDDGHWTDETLGQTAEKGLVFQIDGETGEILSRGPDLFVGYTAPR